MFLPFAVISLCLQIHTFCVCVCSVFNVKYISYFFFSQKHDVIPFPSLATITACLGIRWIKKMITSFPNEYIVPRTESIDLSQSQTKHMFQKSCKQPFNHFRTWITSPIHSAHIFNLVSHFVKHVKNNNNH